MPSWKKRQKKKGRNGVDLIVRCFTKLLQICPTIFYPGLLLQKTGECPFSSIRWRWCLLIVWFEGVSSLTTSLIQSGDQTVATFTQCLTVGGGGQLLHFHKNAGLVSSHVWNAGKRNTWDVIPVDFMGNCLSYFPVYTVMVVILHYLNWYNLFFLKLYRIVRIYLRSTFNLEKTTK